MAKKTVLELVQDILSDMNDDEVSSITDTLEALQVAQIVKSTYEELIAGKNWPHLRTLMQLTASGDSTKPTHMSFDDDVKEIGKDGIHYDTQRLNDTRPKYERMIYLFPDEFLLHLNGRNSDNTNVDIITDDSGVELLIRTDTPPEFWTSFDDETLVFDGYDSEVDTTLQKSKTQAIVFRLPVFTLLDAFVPDLPEEAFPALLAESKSACFARLKGEPDAKSEQQSVRQRNWLSRKAWNAAGGIRLPNYGRTGKKTRRDIRRNRSDGADG